MQTRLTEKAKEKAKKIVEEARLESEAIISDLRALRMTAGASVKEHELIEARKRLENASPKESKKQTPKAKAAARPLQVGDEVKVLSYGQRGTLIDKVSDTEWVVQIGILKMKLEQSGLEFVKPEKEKKMVASTAIRGRDQQVKLELDLRGERYEDAIRRTEKYLDDALLSNYHQVSIIHGKGTGALRQGIQTYLKSIPA